MQLINPCWGDGVSHVIGIVLVVATAVALAGCAGTESATQAAFRAADAECTSLGAKPGTDAYAECRLAIDMRKANAELAAEAARQQGRARPR
jgi:hypothetical protein